MRQTHLGEAINDLGSRNPGPAHTQLPALGSRARRERAQAFPAKVCTPLLDSRGPPLRPTVGQRRRGLQRGSEHTAEPRGRLWPGALPEQVGDGRPGRVGEPTTPAAPGVPAPRPPRLPSESWPRRGEPPGPGPRGGKEPGGWGWGS